MELELYSSVAREDYLQVVNFVTRGDLVKVWNSKYPVYRTKFYMAAVIEEPYFMEPDDEDRMGDYYCPVLGPRGRNDEDVAYIEVIDD